MGFSTVAAFSIIFVFSLIAFGLMYSTVADIAKTYSAELGEKKERIEDTSNTNLEITGITTTPLTGTHNLSFTLKNTGTPTLHPEKFDIIIDGLRYDFAYSTTPLYPGTEVNFSVSDVPGGINTTHRLKVVAENGYSLYLEYQVT